MLVARPWRQQCSPAEHGEEHVAVQAVAVGQVYYVNEAMAQQQQQLQQLQYPTEFQGAADGGQFASREQQQGEGEEEGMRDQVMESHIEEMAHYMNSYS